MRKVSFLLLTVLLLSSCTKKTVVNIVETEKKVETRVDINLSVSETTFQAIGGSIDVMAECNLSLSVTECPEWISVAKTGETGIQIFRFTTTENLSNEVRSDSVKLTGSVSTDTTYQYASATILFTQLK